MKHKNILIISDIEGSSACWSYRASSFLTRAWRRSCVGMTKDVNEVVKGLFEAGVEQITVKDFHRTGYNILSEGVDPRARLVSGYRRGPVPGIGDPGNATAVMFLGMHAASGTDGFLAHTMTSRISRLEVNGKPIPEVALFSASLAPYGLQPVFFSGCPVACNQAQAVITGIHIHPIDKRVGEGGFNADSWRSGLAAAAVESLQNDSAVPYMPKGPFQAVLTMRDGEQPARKIARRWNLSYKDARIFVDADNIHEL
ncbi:MAG: M55 family metallopeptidase, partial [Deltaproteobacteria bacterium]|nr:M55 family metallopeptidase [Deltaproteobacteria bacterium]